jgi:pimeloyl-ACP methyl ester carboxylesterase
MKNILIAAIDHALGLPLAARYLASSDLQIFYLFPHTDARLAEELKVSLRTLARELLPEAASAECIQQLENRFHVVSIDCRTHETTAHPAIHNLSASTIWFISGGCFPASRSARNATITNMLKIALAAIPAVKASEFNYACSTIGAIKTDHDLALLQQKEEEYVAERCRAHGAEYRTFYTGNFLATTTPFCMRDGHDFLQFIKVLHDVQAEVEGRAPQYFAAEPLRCYMPPNTAISLVRLDKLVETMVHLQQTAMGPDGKYYLTSPARSGFADLCHNLGEICRVKLLVVEDRRQLNSIDLVLDQRMEYFRQTLLLSQGGVADNVTRISPDSFRLDGEKISNLVEAVCKGVNEADLARKRCSVSRSARLEIRTIDKNGELSYFAGGVGGPPLVILNALGQRLEYWYALIETLMCYRRVIVWELRGLILPSPFRMADQVDDLAAILKQEGVDACHLLGWCTGPKVGLKFYLRCPQAVLSMICLNSTFKWPGSPKELSTPYEEGLERVCQLFTTDAKLGALMVNILKKSMEEGDAAPLSGGSNGESRAAEVLSKTNKDLLPHIMAPFENKEIAVKYSRQILEFFSYDAREDAKQMQVPVLLISCDFDKIAAPAMSRVGQQMFPVSRYLQIQGATHHCIYDRPELVAGLVEDFLLDPKASLTEGHEVKELAIDGASKSK